MHDHDRKYVKSFFSDISAWSNACNSIAVSYIAYRTRGEYVLAAARLFLEVWPRTIKRTVYTFDSLKAGVFDLNELDMTPEAFIKVLEKGGFLTPEGKLPFLPEDNGGYSAFYNPYMNEGVEAGYRLSLLSIHGGALIPYPNYMELDWELKSGKMPFDSVNDLLLELSLGTERTDTARVEIVAYNCLQPELAEPFGRIKATKAQPALLLANGLDKSKAALGFRMFNQGKVILRERLDGNDLEWNEVEGGLRGSKELDIPEGAVLNCFASFAGKAQIQWWLSDPSTSQNPLRAVYNTFDQGLEVLNDFLEKGPGKGNARDLETAMAWLLWMLGFKVAHLGATARNQEAPDLIATTSLGHFLVIECTTGLLKAENKLPLLVGRTEILRKSLDASGSHHLRALPVIVTNRNQEEVAADIEQAEKLGVLVITRGAIQTLLNQTLVFPNAEKMYVEAERTVKEAKEKHSPNNTFNVLDG